MCSAAIKCYQNRHFSYKYVDCQSNSFCHIFQLEKIHSMKTDDQECFEKNETEIETETETETQFDFHYRSNNIYTYYSQRYN